MEERNIDRLIELVKKTGDKLVFLDKNSKDDAWILMSLNDYENLVENRGKISKSKEDLTIYSTEDKIEKINQDIAILQEESRDEVVNEIVNFSPDLSGNVDQSEAKEEGQFYFEPVE